MRICGQSAAAEKLRLLPTAERMVAFLAQKDELLSRVLSQDIYEPSVAVDYLNQRFFNDETLSEDFEKRFMNIDRQSWLVDESLLRTDKMTMAFGLEERVPILDYQLVEIANKIPTSWKINFMGNTPNNFQGKNIWREAISQYLPPHILNQKKRGWFTPMAKWLRGGLRQPIEEILLSNDIDDSFFNQAELRKVWQNHLDGREYNLNIIWAVAMWKLWRRIFIKTKI